MKKLFILVLSFLMLFSVSAFADQLPAVDLSDVPLYGGFGGSYTTVYDDHGCPRYVEVDPDTGEPLSPSESSCNALLVPVLGESFFASSDDTSDEPGQLPAVDLSNVPLYHASGSYTTVYDDHGCPRDVEVDPDTREPLSPSESSWNALLVPVLGESFFASSDDTSDKPGQLPAVDLSDVPLYGGFGGSYTTVYDDHGCPRYVEVDPDTGEPLSPSESSWNAQLVPVLGESFFSSSDDTPDEPVSSSSGAASLPSLDSAIDDLCSKYSISEQDLYFHLLKDLLNCAR